MAASEHSKVSAYGFDLKKNLGSHFRYLKTLKKSKLYLDNFSSHLEKTMREGKYQGFTSCMYVFVVFFFTFFTKIMPALKILKIVYRVN